MTSGPTNIQKQFELTLRFLFEFLKHPVKQITLLPEWGWSHLSAVLLGTAAISGALSGLVSHNIYQFIFGLFFLPLISVITEFILTSFLYYYFQVFERRIVSFRLLWTLVIFANIPFFLFQVLSNLIAPITLVGFAFSGFLLVVGLSENFKLEKTKALRLIGILFFVVFSVWLWNKFQISSLDRRSSL